MQELKPLGKLRTLQILIVETQNELQKCQIMDRLYGRLDVENNTYSMAMGANQKKMAMFNQTLPILEDFLSEELANSTDSAA